MIFNNYWIRKGIYCQLKKFGFIKNEDESCGYKNISGSIVVFLILYVDDILIMGNDILTLQSVKAWLSSNFLIKDGRLLVGTKLRLEELNII